MRLLFRLLCLLSFAQLCSCAGLKKAQQRRQIAAANATLERYKQGTPPAEQLADLLDAHPVLAGTTVRIVKERDTVRIAAQAVSLQLPAVSTPTTDKAFIDSLMATTDLQFHAKDSATFAARLRAELASRPKLSRDTVTRTYGAITVKLWVDARGRPQARVVKAAQAVGYEKTVTETKAPDLPKPDIGFFPRLWLFIQDAALLIVLLIIGGVVLLVVAMARRRKEPAA